MKSKASTQNHKQTSLTDDQISKSADKTSHSRRSFLGKAAVVTAAAGLSISKLGELEGLAQFRVPADNPPGGAPPLDCPAGCEEGSLKGVARADTARQRRVSAADYERNMTIPSHPCNGDEVAYSASLNFFASYSKGMPHP